MPTASNVLGLIGGTPLVELHRFGGHLPVRLVAKLEAANPGGSVKDRIAAAMIEDAEASGALKPGMEIVEPTSGNTGIGLALVAAAKGYPPTLTMTESMSVERRALLAAYGARLVFTPAAEGMRGAVGQAEELAQQPDVFLPQQFENPSNPDVHRRTTALEVWDDTEGAVDIFIAGVGAVLRDKKPEVHTVAVERAESAVLFGGAPGPHGIQGIGAGFIPGVLDTEGTTRSSG